MSAYLIVNYDVTDEAGFREYQANARPVMKGGTLRVLDGASDGREGSPGTNTVVIEYPDKATALAAYEGDDYQAVIGLRLAATSNGRAVIVDGFSPPT